MPTSRITVSIDSALLKQLDQLIAERVFPNRSEAIQVALEDKLALVSRSRLAVGCTKLRPTEEVALAEEGIASELEQWPEY